MPTVAAAAPGASTKGQVVFENQNWNTSVTGTEPQFFDIRDWTFAGGAAFT